MAITVDNARTNGRSHTTVSVAADAADGDTLLFFLCKDDDVATSTRPSGLTLLKELESNNAIYAELYKREADGEGYSMFENS